MPSLPERLPGPRAASGRLLLAAALAGALLPRALLGAAVEGLRAELWLTDQALGTLVTAFAGAFAAAWAAALLAPAPIAPRLRGPPLVAAGLLLCGAGTAAAAWAGGFWSLVAARVAAGAGAGLAASPRALARPPDPAPPPRHLLAGAAAALALGLALGGPAGAWLGWRGAFLAAGIALAGLGMACLPAGRGAPAPAPAAAPAPGAAGRWPVLAGMALAAAGLTGAISWLPAFLERARGVPRPAAGLELGAALALAGLLGPALAGSPRGVAGRIPLPAVRAAWGASAAGLATAGALWHSSPLVYWPCLLAAVLSAAAGAAAALSWPGGGGPRVADLALAAVAGELSGAFGVGALADRVGFGRALLVIPAALLAAGALLAVAARTRRARVEPGLGAQPR